MFDVDALEYLNLYSLLRIYSVPLQVKARLLPSRRLAEIDLLGNEDTVLMNSSFTIS
jgi:hypothetical protein